MGWCFDIEIEHVSHVAAMRGQHPPSFDALRDANNDDDDD